jgi:hypothetical protein
MFEGDNDGLPIETKNESEDRRSLGDLWLNGFEEMIGLVY